MIYDTFDHLDIYFKSDEPLYKALVFARDFDVNQPDARYDIQGDDMFALVMGYQTKAREESKFEAHKNYIDVQLLLEGREFLDVSLQVDLKVDQPYSQENDVVLFKPPQHYCRLGLQPGRFALLYPHDIHRPCCELDGAEQVRKMVVKIRV